MSEGLSWLGQLGVAGHAMMVIAPFVGDIAVNHPA
jgi:hypothetical protein